MPVPQASAPRPAALTRRDLEARIVAKAWKDPSYKARLLSEVLGDNLEVVAPQTVAVVVVAAVVVLI